MLKFLIFLLLIFFVIRYFSRMFVVTTFNDMQRKMQDEMNRRNQQPSKPEGTISVDTHQTPKSASRSNESGDYVDYEEIK